LASADQRRFVVLDGMRGVAAIAVAMLHSAQIIFGDKDWRAAYLAVDFFFCLSGFIVAHAYSERLQSGSMTVREFGVRRLGRLYPLFLVGVAIGAIATLGAHVDRLGYVSLLSVATLLLVPAGFLFGQQAYPTNNPLWSLTFEFFANAAYAVIAQRSVTFWNVLTALLAVALVCAVLLYGELHRIGYQDPLAFCLGLARVGFPFAAGVLIYRCALHKKGPSFGFALPTGALAILLLAFPQDVPSIELCAVLIVIPTLIWVGSRADPGRAAPVLHWLGLLSYPFYIIHQPILRLARHLPHHTDAEIWAAASGGIAASGVLAYALLRWFDDPVQARLRTMITKGRNKMMKAATNTA
jgi:peptidoglycan/LPS O-acetylase OafA/YrhL